MVTRTTTELQPTTPSSRHLWQMMDTGKLRTYLSDGLWLARLDQFNDPREGSLPRANVGLLNKLPRSQVPEVQDHYRYHAERAYASCWHMSDSDPTPAAWAAFGAGLDSLAIRTTPTLMRDAIAAFTGATGPVHIGVIRYIDHLQDVIPESNILEASFTVGSNFSTEQEARVLVSTVGTEAYDRLYGKQGPFGKLIVPTPPTATEARGFKGGYQNGTAIVLPIDSKALIEEIVIGPNVPPSNRQEIIDLVQDPILKARIRP